MTNPAQRLKLQESSRFLEHAPTVIPGASHTFSKAPSQLVGGVALAFCDDEASTELTQAIANDDAAQRLEGTPVEAVFRRP